jgi:hypothetical protein
VRTRGIDREPSWKHSGVICWFISPHGFGHAARACSVIADVTRLCGGIRHHLFTTVPPAFFDDSLAGVAFEYHRLECDIGMVQRTPFIEDVGATIRALERLPLDGGPVFECIASEVSATGCQLIISDIAPLGLAVAESLSLPGVLIENFTWDWIYGAYGDPRLDGFSQRLATIFGSAAVRIQTAPICLPVHGAHRVPPVSRSSRLGRNELRSMLGIAADDRLVLLSVGGLESLSIGRGFRPPAGTILVAPGGGDGIKSEGDLIWIPTMGGPYHPDLVAASDLVVAKLGYSTVAEVYHAGTALAFLRRPIFPESPILEGFVREQIPSAALAENWLESPSTTRILEELLETPRSTDPRPNGAAAAAELILNALHRQF